MSLGAPWGLLALGALVPLVAAYFLRRKQKPVVVSALFLWRSPRSRAEAGPRFERFTREASLLLEVLAVVAAALFLADARWGEQARSRHLVLVVDGSLSLSARDAQGVSVMDKVRAEAARRVEETRASRVTVLVSGSVPRVLAGPEAEPSRALAALESFRALGADHEVGPTLRWAQELAGPDERVHFFTDAPPSPGERVPGTVRWTALGAPRDNVGLVSAWRRDEGSTATVTLRVARWGQGPEETEVRVVAAPGPGAREGTERRERVRLPEEGAATLRFTFEGAGDVAVSLPPDALPEDGEVRLPPAVEPPVRVAWAEGLDAPVRSALERVFSVVPGVVVGAAPDGASEAKLFVGPRGSDAEVTLGVGGEVRTFVGPFFAEKSDPLLEDVQLGGVRWAAGAEPPPGRPLMTAGERVLLSEAEGRVHFNLDLSRSNVQRTPAWPVLMGNLVREARRTREGFVRRQFPLGEPLGVATRAGARYTLEGPGEARPLFGAGPLSLPAPAEPGRYALVREGTPVDAVEVLPLDTRESDLRGRGSGEHPASEGRGEQDAGQGAAEGRERWPLWVLLAALLADFFVTRRGEVA